MQYWLASSERTRFLQAMSYNYTYFYRLSHSCCSSNAALARGGLSICLVLEHVTFKVWLHFHTAQFNDNPHVIYLLLPYFPLPFFCSPFLLNSSTSRC